MAFGAGVGLVAATSLVRFRAFIRPAAKGVGKDADIGKPEQAADLSMANVVDTVATGVFGLCANPRWSPAGGAIVFRNGGSFP